jgi:hypothetical protein
LVFSLRHFRLALDTGDRARVARGLIGGAIFSATGGTRTRADTENLLKRAGILAEQTRDPQIAAGLALASGFAAFQLGQWRQAVEQYDQSLHFLRTGCRGMAWEIHMATFYGMVSLFYLGEIAEIRRRLAAGLQDAESRGDRYTVAHLRAIIQTSIHLMDDAPDAAENELERARAAWSWQESPIQHLMWTFIQLQILLYRGQSRAAWELLRENGAYFDRSLKRLQHSRLIWQFGRMIAAQQLAANRATSERERRQLVRSAQADIRRIERENVPWSNPLALLGRANLAAQAGNRAEALPLFAAVEEGFRAADMMLYAMSARRRRGLYLGGAEGQAMIQEADGWMTAQTIRNPERISAQGSYES